MSNVQNRSGLAVARPLYSQVRDLLLERIRRNEWSNGQTLPNELALASEFGVSVGTIRRAVEGLEESGILVRKQGRGTYLAEASGVAAQDRFGYLCTPSGAALNLSFGVVSTNRRSASAREASQLGIGRDAPVVEIRQSVRTSDGPRGTQVSILAADLFPGLETRRDLDQPLYSIYTEFGFEVSRAHDSISVDSCDPDTAQLLELDPATPMLRVDRTAYSYENRPLEYRTALYHMASSCYRNRPG